MPISQPAKDPKIIRVFIVGCPRSGTTLLQAMLAAHPDLFSLPETHFWSFIIPASNIAKCLGLASLRGKKKALEKLKTAGIEEINTLRPHISVFIKDYASAFEKALDQKCRVFRKKGWVEKTPIHLHYIDEINKYIENALFIHILRNGKDVVASLYDVTRKYPQYWGGPRSIEECIRRWVLDTKLSLKYKTNPKHHFISYENLVFNPCHELNLLTQFLKIDFCDQMLTNQKQGYEKIRESNAKWTKRAFRSPEKQLKSKFETVFTRKEQSLIKERLENAGLLTLPNF